MRQFFSVVRDGMLQFFKSVWGDLALRNILLTTACAIIINVSVTLSFFFVDAYLCSSPAFWCAFLGGMAVGCWSIVFDLLFVVFVLALLNKRTNQQLNIQRYKEEIDDYRYWKEPEAAHRTAGIIRRLNRLGVTDVDLISVYLMPNFRIILIYEILNLQVPQ